MFDCCHCCQLANGSTAFPYKDEIISDFIEKAIKAVFGFNPTEELMRLGNALISQLGFPDLAVIDGLFPDVFGEIEKVLAKPFEDAYAAVKESVQCVSDFQPSVLSPKPQNVSEFGASGLEMIGARGKTSVTLDCTGARRAGSVPFLLSGSRRTDRCLKVGAIELRVRLCVLTRADPSTQLPVLFLCSLRSFACVLNQRTTSPTSCRSG